MASKDLFGYTVLSFIWVSELHGQVFAQLAENSFHTDFCYAELQINNLIILDPPEVELYKHYLLI